MNRRAFSLIELLTVLTILGIISTVGYFVTNKVTNNTKEHAMLVMANDVKSGVIDYMIANKPAQNIFQVSLVPLNNDYQNIMFKETDPWGKPYNKLYADVERNSGSLVIDIYMETTNKGCYVLFENNNVLYRSGDTCN